MKRRFFLGAVGAACFAAESAEEKGKRIVKEALAAMGGDAFLKMQDRVESGRAYSFYREKLSGLSRAKLYTRYLAQPGANGLALRERQNFGKDEDQGLLFLENGEGYEITFRGARPLPPARLDLYRESTLLNAFYLFRQRLQTPGLMIEAKGSDVLVNEPVENVEFADPQNLSVMVSFHYSTKLPVRQVFYRRDANRVRHEESTTFGKFRDVGGGVKWPYAIVRQRDGEKIFELYSESVEINQGLKDNLFELPAGAKVLKPA
jgi:hypothetical protein